METVEDAGIDSLASLEDRITRAVRVITDLREENARLAAQVSSLEEERKSGGEAHRLLESLNENLSRERDELQHHSNQQARELEDLRNERKQVRDRIEKLLSQLDLLSAS